ncbi:hypothetical protein [Fischerella thermalis]|uniref:Uncharacterized protein n=4 Tax=Fischerella TaxID=1190 RepID=G6FSL4_9CYAN|nr:hypothetical protein [Fischerella thermalis]PLZ30060.1 hypothetical protein CBP28_08630 [Fischerella thermalis WC559]PMB07728.1 hypothetical protein CI592_08895 [Fischerella thermalis CCMEE 5328]EHC14850.1 hypothetical protein FJSC11DRAFT_1761 [Fischerella thermalis JSC-11]PLZ08331.1 hypothetical protein CBP19_17530 [Fischerella thermalis WC1110]PLZ14540.1 hypothetical protein CBP18_02220 [Fischerella thermalis WC119]
MTKSVTEQKATSSPIYRRHSDPPGLWIAVFTGSVAIHLLAFWMLRLYSYQLSLRQQQNSSNNIPIEIIEISPTESAKAQSQAKVKPASPQSSSLLTNEDAIALIDQKTAIASKPNSSLRQQPSAKPQPTTQPESTPTPELPANQQPDTIPPTPPPDNTDTSTSESENPIPDEQNQALLPNTNPTTPPKDSFPSTNEQLESQLPEQPNANISLGKSTPLPTIDPSLQPPPQLPTDETQTSGGLVATWDAFSRDEMIDLIRKGVVIQDVPPDIVAQPLGDNTKELPVSFISSEPDLDNVDLVASLAIDEKGKLIARDANGNPGVEIIDMTPEELATKKTKYQQLLIDVFQNVSFSPGRNQDVSQPLQSNLFVRVKIERR